MLAKGSEIPAIQPGDGDVSIECRHHMSAEQRLRETLDAFAARVREDLDARAQTLAAELTRAAQEADGAVRAEAERSLAAERQQLDAQLADERAALSALRAEVERTLADERQRFEERLADERAAMAAVRDEAARDRSTALPRLLDAVRRLDAAPSLTSILGVLGQAAHARASRVVVFVVDGDTLKVWADHGYDAGPGVSDVSSQDVKVLAAALATQVTSTFRSAEAERDATLPAFLRPAAGDLALVMPLSVGGDVVAIVFADGPEGAGAGDGGETPQARAAWVDEVELVARYARTRLESVTSERTVSALTRMA